MDTHGTQRHTPRMIGIRQMAALLIAVVLLFLLSSTALLYTSSRSITNHYLQDVGGATLNYYQSQLNYTLQTINDFCRDRVSETGAFAAYGNLHSPRMDYELKSEIGDTLVSLLQLSNSVYFVMSCPATPAPSNCMFRSRCKTLNERNTMRDAVLASLASDDAAASFNTWEWVMVDQTYYLRNIFQFDQFYCAVFLDTSVPSSASDNGGSYYLLCSQGDTPISDNPALQLAPITHPDRIRINGRPYHLMSVASRQGNFSRAARRSEF